MIKLSRGFGLIEILIAVFIVAFGVLAVGKLQVNLLSTSNTNLARQEAIKIAQNRMDELRNYFNSLDDGTPQTLINDTTFSKNFTAKSDVTVNGQNAVFTLSESFDEYGSGNAKIVVVVSWTGLDGDETINLASDISFQSSSSLVGESNGRVDPFIDPPTGRAFLGQGNIDSSKTPSGSKSDSSIGVTVYSYADYENKYLAIDGTGDESSGDKIVLTLEEACVLNTGEDIECTDFVEISGRVFISDNFIAAATKGNGTYLASDVYVLASDAAYWGRYDGNGKVFENTAAGVAFSDLNTDSNSDSAGKYFYYKCYIGGGWHGNIGLVFEPTSQAKVCVGYSGISSTATESRSRTYRGLAYVGSALDGSYVFDYEDVSTLRSWGIADATVITPNDETHDFWLTNDSSASVCEDDMTFTVLSNNQKDFYCLNETKAFAKGIFYPYKTGVDNSLLVTRTNLDERAVDSDRDGVYDKAEYQFESICRIDPTNPPLFMYEFDGTISITSSSTPFDVSNIELLIDPEDTINSPSASCYFTETVDGLTSYSASIINPVSTNSEWTSGFKCFLSDYGAINNSSKELEASGWSGSIYLNESGSANAFTCNANTKTNSGDALVYLKDIFSSSDSDLQGVKLTCTK